MMSRIQKGLIAGFAATTAVSAVDVIAGLVQRVMGEQWFHSFPPMAAAMAGRLLGPAFNSIWVGWAVHFVIGTFVLGGLFAVLATKLPTDTPATKGIVFAVGAWILMSLTIMPFAGLGAFGAIAGFPTVAWIMVTHVLFGFVLGRVFFRLHGDVGHRKRMRPIAA